MLEELEINSFKAFKSARVHLEPFTILVGPNGSGKTSILQAIDLLGSLVKTTISEHLRAHGWDYSDLPHLRSQSSQIEVVAKLLLSGKKVAWALRLESRRRPGIASEKVSDLDSGQVYMERNRRQMTRFNEKTAAPERITQTLTSSWLSAIDVDDQKEASNFPILVRVARWARNIRGYFFLDPLKLRSPSRGDSDAVGPYGDHLASFLGQLHKKHPDRFQRLTKLVKKYYPNLSKLEPKRGQYGWTKLQVSESFGRHDSRLSAAQVSDGLLRLIAVAAMHEHAAGPQLLLMDEIENGMHPALLGGMMTMLQDLASSNEAGTQVIATTHSPIAVNFCRKPTGIQIVTRSEDGTANVTPMVDTKNFNRLRQHFDLGELWYNVGEQRLLPFSR